MAKHTYKIEAKNGELHCYKDGEPVDKKRWEFLKGERMPEMKLFIDGVGVATRKEIEWVGMTDVEYNNIKNGKEVPYYGVVSAEKTVDPATGEMTFRAVRENGEICITVLDKNYHLIKEKCKVIVP